MKSKKVDIEVEETSAEVADEQPDSPELEGGPSADIPTPDQVAEWQAEAAKARARAAKRYGA